MRGGGTDEEGKGRASKRARSKEESLFENDWDEEEEIDDADYEILLTGFVSHFIVLSISELAS